MFGGARAPRRSGGGGVSTGSVVWVGAAEQRAVLPSSLLARGALKLTELFRTVGGSEPLRGGSGSVQMVPIEL